MLNGGRFGNGYAWLVSPCTCVLPQAQVPNRNSARRSTKDAHALKLLATQRGNVRSSNIAAYSRGIWDLQPSKFPIKGSWIVIGAVAKRKCLCRPQAVATYVAATVGSPRRFASVLASEEAFGNY